MKISLVITAALIAVIQAENCFESADCNHLTCGDGTTMRCAQPSDGTARVCTCVGTPAAACTTQADCRRNVCTSTRDPDEHCVDGHCRCLFRGP